MELASSREAIKVVALRVTGAFHTVEMQPAADELETVLQGMSFNKPSVPLIANTDGVSLVTADQVKDHGCSGKTQKCGDNIVKRNHGVPRPVEIINGDIWKCIKRCLTSYILRPATSWKKSVNGRAAVFALEPALRKW